ncbi:ammonium transporter [Protomyces lactucae-debilis]|uniref:Ammonium transporter n=1 Tax=Protomyces lactucae-debilis TaxID=2754530 RepID=A0A1Y2FWU5_PROLT|nr:ammonium transporter [Protomyces lactucae-debilis]ORY87145.1 ammonium transporter [Protomyces lactucae-debilis]
MVFIFVWSTIVYNPIACWTWNPSGWLFKLGSLDFAGGSPVHLSSGTAALAYSYMLGKRREHGAREIAYRPHNVTHVVLGTVFLWFGWQGFNGGSALGANLRACMALFVTNLAAAVGGLTWMLLDYRLERKWSTVGFCSGAISGLVAITPASGYVPPWSAVVFGIVGGIACNLATKLKYVMRVDDAMDIFAVHGIGAVVGNLMTGLFAKKSIAALDGATVISGGWLDSNWIQLGYQLADTVTVFAYSFAVTCAILAIMNYIPGLSLRASEDAERLGMDEAEIGEFAYDYVERARDHAHVVVMEGQHVSSSNSMSEKTADKESATAAA